MPEFKRKIVLITIPLLVILILLVLFIHRDISPAKFTFREITWDMTITEIMRLESQKEDSTFRNGLSGRFVSYNIELYGHPCEFSCATVRNQAINSIIIEYEGLSVTERDLLQNRIRQDYPEINIIEDDSKIYAYDTNGAKVYIDYLEVVDVFSIVFMPFAS